MVTSAAASQEAELVRRTDKKGRRLWKSFSVEASEEVAGSEGAAVKEVSWGSRYGEVVPAIRLQLAEQDNIEAQLRLARELLLEAQLAGRGEEEVHQETAAVEVVVERMKMMALILCCIRQPMN